MASESFATFGELLVYLRKRARLTQEELGCAVGYSRTQITLLEKNQRLPSRDTVVARFLPALDVDSASELAQRLIELAASARRPRTNLPGPLTRFIGHEKDIVQVQELIASQRLTTCIGPGGVGKTRLALQASTEGLKLFEDGVWWIELAPLSDPARLIGALATTLGVRESADHGIEDALIRYLRAWHCLLILDNCEHLLDACAHLAATLLQACPDSTSWLLAARHSACRERPSFECPR
jgi:transcriptional regulator with XRE-family HTH domain